MRIQKNQGGFTIVEIIVGLTVATIFTFGIVILITTLITINDKARDLSLSNGLAENKIESLRSADFVSLEDGTYDFSDELPQTIGKTGNATYQISSVNSALKQIYLTIEYDEKGITRTLEYRTYIGELGVGQ